MAASLEELLAEEGFKAKMPPKIISRNSIGSQSVSMPLFRSKNESNNTSETRIKTHRTRSDMSRYNRKDNELPPIDRNRESCRRARDNLVSRVLERRNSTHKVKESKKFSCQSSVDILESEVVQVGVDENESVKDIYSNGVHHSSKENRGKQRYNTSNSSDHKKSVKKIENYDIKSVASSQNGNNAEDSERNRQLDNKRFSSAPALDEVAVQAMISILTSYIARFLKEEEYRTSLRHSCFSLLKVAEIENESDNKIMANLEQAIDMVERVVEETTNVRDLKKASLLLSVISGLNSNDLKDGFTAGIPNSTLSACAHLYLSTYQFAVYYKDWLAQDVETPSMPSILIPSLSVKTAELENSHGNSAEMGSPSTTTFSPKLMVSKRLYNSVFTHGSMPCMDEVEGEELGKSNNDFRSFDGSATDENQEMNCPSERVKHMDQDIEVDQTKNAAESKPQPELPSTKAGEDQTLQGVRAAVEREEIELGHPNEDSYESSHLSSIPEEFICPLSRHLFEDPITLETGQTFERVAIKEWFDQGNRTCPLENRKYSIYREEAVDAISVALEESLTDTSVKDRCCRALLILGGYFSYSGEVATEKWMLKQACFDKGCAVNVLENYERGLRVDDLSQQDDEKQAKEEWLKNLSATLIVERKKSFLESTSRCLGSEDLDFVGVCLTTVAWLSTGLASLPDAELQLSAFSSLISRLKESLENGNRVEHQVLASMSLLNFSKIPECRVLLMTIAKDIVVPLRQLSEATWTAKQLYDIISGEHL
ncbi:U-box domain [Dillenia turbinata]|uniref:U-box domain n=1 Tax=Dillenia turbinata TaxID=194707 RepID=A0AAN8VDJ4_9MAGN